MPLSRTQMFDLVESLEPRLRRQFLRLVNQARDAQSLNRIATLLFEGRVNEATQGAVRVAQNYGTDINAAVVRAGNRSAELITDVLRDSTFTFSITTASAVALMRENQLRFVREFTQQQVAATRVALLDGFERGLNPRATARLFQDSIGLTANQMASVVRFRQLLEEGSAEALTRQLRDRRFDSKVRRAVAGERALTRAEITRMVERYRQRWVKFRSETIARTESLRAAHQGADESILQAIDLGDLEADSLEQIWHTARDGRVRDSHNGMNRQIRDIGEPFVSDAGNLLRYPGDAAAPASETIRCRCAKATRFKRRR